MFVIVVLDAPIETGSGSSLIAVEGTSCTGGNETMGKLETPDAELLALWTSELMLKFADIRRKRVWGRISSVVDIAPDGLVMRLITSLARTSIDDDEFDVCEWVRWGTGGCTDARSSSNGDKFTMVCPLELSLVFEVRSAIGWMRWCFRPFDAADETESLGNIFKSEMLSEKVFKFETIKLFSSFSFFFAFFFFSLQSTNKSKYDSMHDVCVSICRRKRGRERKEKRGDERKCVK